MQVGVLYLASTLHLVIGAAVFNWPDPLLDNLDSQLYEFSSVSVTAVGCKTRDNSTVATQWLRLGAYAFSVHFATLLIVRRIMTWLRTTARPAPEVWMLRSNSSLIVHNSPRFCSVADVIAMATINAVVGCGGPVIPFKGGRIDATEAGPATVPEPQQDLPSHIASFAAQGFNETEMIMLVACGHSLGGVRQVDFPLVVTEDVPTGIQNFASTVDLITHVTEYLDGTTQNVLVVGSNITTRSDFRIFSSDGNVPMQNVTLTDTIEPFDFKVQDTSLYPQGGSLVFLATLRVIDTGLNRTVTMFWKERTGTFCPAAGCSSPVLPVINETPSHLAQLKGVNRFNRHSFTASIDLATSISHFWFEVNDNDGSAPFVVDNNGANYTIDQDVLLYDRQRTSSTFESGSAGRMIVAVKDSTTTTVISLTTNAGNATVPFTTKVIDTSELDSSFTPADGYIFYSFPFSVEPLSHTIHASINGTAYSVYIPGSGEWLTPK
ncbi:heme peroxidase [Mycena sanguinolenta]|nr:heme peroxidase [Mycena sanguinolenta]